MLIKLWFLSLHPIYQALLASLFTWACTALGSACVFFVTTVNRKFLDSMLGFAAGVMIAASFWSLLNPAIELATAQGMIPWVPPLVGFLAGGLFLWLFDRFLPHLHLGLAREQAEGPKTNWRRSILLVLAITIHNIPEGLAVGVAFGALALDLPSANLGAAIALAIGIGLQNFPEGMAVSLPLRRDGLSRYKSFWYGQLSAIVEPVAAVVGAVAVVFITPILPYALAFAAGAMIYVVIEELIPQSQLESDSDYSTVGAMIGFATMMVLDVGLG